MYELLTMTDPMREAVAARATAAEIRRIMSSEGSPTLRADGLRLVLAGVTTPTEVLRVAAV
jgi:general secretion pathway protein E